MAEGNAHRIETAFTITKDVLEDYYEQMCQKVDKELEDKTPVEYLLHSTTLRGKNGIIECGRMIAGATDMPKYAPLSKLANVAGVWFEAIGTRVSKRSPYGSKRIKVRLMDIIEYLASDVEKQDDPDLSTVSSVGQDLERISTDEACLEMKNKVEEPKIENETVISPLQREFYLKSTLPRTQNGDTLKRMKRKVDDAKVHVTSGNSTHLKKSKSEVFTLPLLFFECAHYYGKNQYIRLILVRQSDPSVAWCRATCQELHLQNNPFLELNSGRMWTYTRGVRMEILVVGDIVLNQLSNCPVWDSIGKAQRAGYDPKPGVC